MSFSLDNNLFLSQKGIFGPVFATSSEVLQQKISSIPIIKNLAYGVTNMLTWRLGEIDLKLVTNLPEEEILKVARSLVSAENGERNIHPNQKTQILAQRISFNEHLWHQMAP